jgi:hypothetical protein
VAPLSFGIDRIHPYFEKGLADGVIREDGLHVRREAIKAVRSADLTIRRRGLKPRGYFVTVHAYNTGTLEPHDEQ